MKLGKAFPDSLIVEEKTTSRLSRREGSFWWIGAGRALFFTTILFLAFFVLLWRLFDLTIIQGHRMRTLADGNRTRELVRHAPRGRILDRTGRELVSNEKIFRLVKPCGKLTEGCREQLNQEEATKLRGEGLPAGWFLETDYVRVYADERSLSHLLGYTGELTGQELGQEYYQLRFYGAGDRVGRMGVEAVFEEKLRGRDGRDLVEVDAQGKVLRTLGSVQELPGEDIVLSVDRDLAIASARAFPKDEKGAVVVTKPATGEILAMYTSPTFDANDFSRGLSTEEYRKLTEDPHQPLFNRAIGGAYPPGSTFKIVTALGALEEGAMRADTTVEDIGVIKIGPASFPNWYFTQYGKTEGMVDMLKAIARSNDIYFYKAGEALGITKLAKWAHIVGVGKTLGIEVPGEASGLMPDPSWKESYFTSAQDQEARNNLWYLGDTYHVAIGQGYLLTTPLQVNSWTNLIASGGTLCKPTILKETRNKKQETNCKDLGIKKKTIDLITEGMKRACEPGGTGWPLFNFKVKSAKSKAQSEQSVATDSSGVHSPLPTPDLFVPLACKTGTAEFGDPNNKTHAWFTVFAPIPTLDTGDQYIKSGQEVTTGEPEISVTVLVEGAGEGSDVAAPIAKKILEAWFSR